MKSDFWKRLEAVTPRETDPDRVLLLRKATGVSQPSVSNWRTGATSPSLANVRKIAEALGTSFSYLWDGTEGKAPRPEEPEAVTDGELLTLVVNKVLRVFLVAGLAPEEHSELFAAAVSTVYRAAERSGEMDTSLLELSLKARRA